MAEFKQWVEQNRSQVDAQEPYRLPPTGFAGAPPLPWFAKGEVGIASLGFSFFGFFASRLPRCSPLAMAILPSPQIRG
jgi:hypothetical protein